MLKVTTSSAVSSVIANRMEIFKISQYALSAAASVDDMTISRIIKGQHEDFSLEYSIRMLCALGLAFCIDGIKTVEYSEMMERLCAIRANHGALSAADHLVIYRWHSYRSRARVGHFLKIMETLGKDVFIVND